MGFGGNWIKTCVVSKETYQGKATTCRKCNGPIKNGDLSVAVRTRKIKKLVARFCTNKDCLDASVSQRVKNIEWGEKHPEAVVERREIEAELRKAQKELSKKS